MTPTPPRPAPRRIGVIVLRQIGDVLLTTPALAALRQHYPGARITALINDFTAPMLENNPDVDEVWTYPRAARPATLGARLSSEWRL
ncbi:MAG TPA: putative lipopolysaccharide heptosyltransferase III, partial [Verrucomicrobiae bacterium]|nr:putative lipopolysaccharide heptosyltransferase III [Verrucomicrobiae bacterium]